MKPFAFTKPHGFRVFTKEYTLFSERSAHENHTCPVYSQLALRADSDIRKASGFVITTEPPGFVLTKEVNVLLLRVQMLCFTV